MLTDFIKRVFGRRGFELVRVGHCNVLDFLLETVLRTAGEVRFVQVGANDGRRNDPIYPFVTRNQARVTGLVLEPVGEYFEQLKRTYRNVPRVKPVNVAIHRTAKHMTIHRVDSTKQADLGKKRAGIASFNAAHHELTGTPSSVMIEEIVDCITLTELLDEHGYRELDLLLIDTEGYDAEIVRSIDFSSVIPKIIRFEHGRLKPIPPDTFRELCSLFRRLCYELMV